jgi:hypothetical protein
MSCKSNFFAIFFHLRLNDKLDAIIRMFVLLRVANNIALKFLLRFTQFDAGCCCRVNLISSFLDAGKLPHIRGLEVDKAAFWRDDNFDGLGGFFGLINLVESGLVSSLISNLLNFEVLGALNIVVLGKFCFLCLAHLISMSPFLSVVI